MEQNSRCNNANMCQNVGIDVILTVICNSSKQELKWQQVSRAGNIVSKTVKFMLKWTVLNFEVKYNLNEEIYQQMPRSKVRSDICP